MQYLKLLAFSSAFILIGAGCAATPDTRIDDQGGLEPTTSAVPAPTEQGNGLGVSVDVDEMIVNEGIDSDELDAMEGIEGEDIGAPSDDSAMVPEPGHVITFDGSKYSVTNLTINVGDTVTWKNNSTKNFWPASNVHPSHQILPGFDAMEPMAGGTSYSFTFSEAGSWPWHDHLRARVGGTITVR